MALLEGTGPLHPYLTLVRAIESASIYDIRSAADALMMSLPSVNRAVLKALTTASQLD